MVHKNNELFSPVEAVNDSLPISQSDSSTSHVVRSEALLHESDKMFTYCGYTSTTAVEKLLGN